MQTDATSHYRRMSSRVIVGPAFWACILVGLLLRLAYNYEVPPETWGDTFRYEEIAAYWTTEWAPWEVSTPLDLRGGFTYPFMLSTLYLVFGHGIQPVVSLQHFLGLLLIPLTFSLGLRAFSPAVGILAALLVALDPGLIRYEHKVMTEIPFTFLFMLSIYALVRGMQTATRLPLAVAGVCLGLAILTRPNVQFLALAIPLVLLGSSATQVSEAGWRSALRSWVVGSAVFLIATSAVILPWVARNYVGYGYAGISAISGQMHKKTKAFGTKEGNYPEIRKMKGNPQARMISDGYTWLESDRILREIASEDIRKQPVTYLRESGPILVSMWNKNDYPRWEAAMPKRDEYKVNAELWQEFPGSLSGRAKHVFHTYIWPWVPPAMLAGLFIYAIGPFFAWLTNLMRRRPVSSDIPVRMLLLLPIAYIAVTGALASDTGNPRYRLVVDPLIFLFAGATVVGGVRIAARAAARLQSRPRFVGTPAPKHP